MKSPVWKNEKGLHPMGWRACSARGRNGWNAVADASGQPQDRPVSLRGVMPGRPGAVSYTHLDVYKRQTVNGPFLPRMVRSVSWPGTTMGATDFSGANGVAMMVLLMMNDGPPTAPGG